MNEILRSLAGLTEDTFDEAEGVDKLFLDAVHLRAFLLVLEATEKTSFLDSFLYQAILVGATYSVVLKITKLYDREKDKYKINTLRKLWKKVEVGDTEARLITKEFNTQNEKVFFNLY